LSGVAWKALGQWRIYHSRRGIIARLPLSRAATVPDRESFD
jgi:hypothetical protein